MNMLERLLGHDYASTRELLVICLNLSDGQMDRPVDAGWGTLRKTLDHVISNVEIWTDLMMERSVNQFSGQDSAQQMLDRLDSRYPEFAAFALQVEREGRLDDLWTDILDEPPMPKSYGGAIGHLITHGMHHRAEILHIMKRVGVEDLPEGDLMGWDQRRRLSHQADASG